MIDLGIMLLGIYCFFVGSIVGSVLTIAIFKRVMIHKLPVSKVRYVYREAHP